MEIGGLPENDVTATEQNRATNIDKRTKADLKDKKDAEHTKPSKVDGLDGVKNP